ncbi:hypothetical protein E4T38_06014 [Aureobasidium subglaciale]|nr:hypothetical protein E4T38_06014 [Aureobasidium subglaciale]KAI5220064.1 hypothetical protein E4T40_06035 [Aureobasidium subglaciale]KAI5224015.1 hypothetical protein E4T41_05875 [Aureobasidium subglaciale]KAI5260687.1 hypothetical protein E4T46_05769 [Aureobasidium subglaciale]
MNSHPKITIRTAGSTILLLCKTAKDNCATIALPIYRKPSMSRTLTKFVLGCRSATCLSSSTSFHRVCSHDSQPPRMQLNRKHFRDLPIFATWIPRAISTPNSIQYCKNFAA